MMKKKINSANFAKRLGAYSHGYSVDVGDAVMIFTTGQIAFDKDGSVVFAGDVSKQAAFIYERLDQILHEAGASLDDVVKTTVYLTDMNDFPKFTEVRNRYLKNSEPASTLVEVSTLVKEGCVVEIEVIAVKQK
jgi:2-iminobutanoate/2-iminopropanoate deaminase